MKYPLAAAALFGLITANKVNSSILQAIPIVTAFAQIYGNTQEKVARKIKLNWLNIAQP